MLVHAEHRDAVRRSTPTTRAIILAATRGWPKCAVSWRGKAPVGVDPTRL